MREGLRRVGAPEDLVQILGYKAKINKGISEALMTKCDLIIATGGGAILRPENVDALRQNGTLVHITRSIDKLPTRGRPLSKNIETLKKMEAQRTHFLRRPNA